MAGEPPLSWPVFGPSPPGVRVFRALPPGRSAEPTSLTPEGTPTLPSHALGVEGLLGCPGVGKERDTTTV